MKKKTNTEFKQEARQTKPNDTAQLPLPLASHDTEQAAYDSSHLADNEAFVGNPLDAFWMKRVLVKSKIMNGSKKTMPPIHLNPSAQPMWQTPKLTKNWMKTAK